MSLAQNNRTMKLDKLRLLRINGEENGNEFLYTAILIHEDFDSQVFNNFLQKLLCERPTQHIQINELGPLSDYLRYNADGPFGLDDVGRKNLSLIESSSVADLLCSGGGLFIEDVNFDEFKYVFKFENEKIQGIDNKGDLVLL